MREVRRTLIALSAGLAVLMTLLTGCEDSATKARAEVQEQLTDAANKFQAVVLSHTGALDEAGRKELEGVLNQVNTAGTNASAGAGQKSAAALLAADIHRVLADSQASVIDELRAGQRAQRLALHSMISAAERMQVIAAALEGDNVEEQLAALAQQRSLAEDALRAEQAKIAEVDPPLTQLETKIGGAKQQVTQLRTEENDLRRRAAELGHFQGLPTYEQAVEVRKRADVIETATSYDELQRDYEYAPVREMHETRISQLEAAIASIDAASQELQEGAASSKALGSKTRQDLNTLMDRINKELAELTTRMDSQLKPAIDAAAQDLSAAADKAKRAADATPAGGSSARLTSAAASSALGQLQAAWAYEQEQYASLLKRLDGSNIPGAAQQHGSKIGAAEEAQKASVDAAVAAFNEAVSAYQRITGSNSAAVLGLQHDVQVQIASLTGQAAPEAPVAETPAPDAGATGAAPAPSTPGQSGADSPEALAAALQNMNNIRGLLNLANLQIPAEHANYPAGPMRDFITAFSDSLNASLELLQALDEKFGAAAADQILAPSMAGLQAGMGGATVSSASVASTTDTEAQISVSMSNGQSQTIPAKQINGRWYMDFFGSSMQAGGNQQGMEQMVQMMLPMMQASTTATRSIAQRVRAGEFATPADVTAAIQKAAQDAMGSMPQGFPGQPRQ